MALICEAYLRALLRRTTPDVGAEDERLSAACEAGRAECTRRALARGECTADVCAAARRDLCRNDDPVDASTLPW
jgi:hypothetical protein